MLTDVSLKVKKSDNNNKFHPQNFFRNILNPLMPKIQRKVIHAFKILQRMILNLITNFESARCHLHTLIARGLRTLTLSRSLEKIELNWDLN